MNRNLTFHTILTTTLVVSLLFTMVVILVIFLREPGVRDEDARRLIGIVQSTNDPNACRLLTELIDKQLLSKKIGDEALRVLIYPSVSVREEYLEGRRVFVAVNCRSYPDFRRLNVDCSGEAIVGQEVLSRFTNGMRIRPDVFPHFQFPRAVDANGKVNNVNATGIYTGRITLGVALLPETPTKLSWPGKAPFPYKLLPTRVWDQRALKTVRMPVYSCTFDIPVTFQVASQSSIKAAKMLSNPALDLEMLKSFSISTNHLPLGTIAIKYTDLPENFAFRVKFQEMDGQNYISETLYWPFFAGESGDIFLEWAAAFVGRLAPGHHKGQLILYTDQDAPYEHPGIESVWLGTLSYPIEVNIATRHGEGLLNSTRQP
jgi:hypothetical protein